MKPNELADMNRKIWIMKTCSPSIIDDQVGNAWIGTLWRSTPNRLNSRLALVTRTNYNRNSTSPFLTETACARSSIGPREGAGRVRKHR